MLGFEPESLLALTNIPVSIAYGTSPLSVLAQISMGSTGNFEERLRCGTARATTLSVKRAVAG